MPAVVVVAYGSEDELDGCLTALHGADLVVVDNGRTARAREVVERHGATYVDPGRNGGFAAGVNAGLRAVGPGRDVCLVNPDARVDPAGILELQRAMLAAGDRCAAVAPALVDRGGRRQPTSWPLPTPRWVWASVVGLGDRAEPRRFLAGTVLLLRAEALADVGGFDERFFLYGEEASWQMAALRRGWSVREVATVVAEHLGAGSSDDEAVRVRRFQRGADLFVRTWYGPAGAAAFRAGAVVAAVRRMLTGAPGQREVLAALLGRGDARGTSLRVVHAVRSDAFAGVERYVAVVAAAQHAAGLDVAVVGGDPARMRAALPPGVDHVPARTVVDVARALAGRRCDVVHAHLTAAEVAAVLTRPLTGARVVTTRHIAAPRGASRLGRWSAPLVRRGVAVQLAPSDYVAGRVGEPVVVVPNPVTLPPGAEAAGPRDDLVLVLQRLEPEKGTDVAVRAWARSGLAAEQWRLAVAGGGSQAGALAALADRLGVGDSVDLLGPVESPGPLLARAGIVLSPTPVEAFGLAAAEAALAGAPVVAAEGGAHAEVLGPAAALFPPGDHAAAAGLLRRLAHDPAGRAARGASLQAFQRQRHGVAQHVERLTAVYGARHTE